MLVRKDDINTIRKCINNKLYIINSQSNFQYNLVDYIDCEKSIVSYELIMESIEGDARCIYVSTELRMLSSYLQGMVHMLHITKCEQIIKAHEEDIQ